MTDRIAELHQWSQETGQPLPMDAADIALYEQDGYTVDLDTGEVAPATAEAAGLDQALLEAWADDVERMVWTFRFK